MQLRSLARSLCTTRCRLQFDGASRGNPGPAGAGSVLRSLSDGRLLWQHGCYLGTATNNAAEYRSLLYGMEAALAHGVQHLEAQGDSKLVVMQVKGVWKVKHQLLRTLHQQTLAYVGRFQTFNIFHIPRELNGEADALANEGVDSGAPPLSWLEVGSPDPFLKMGPLDTVQAPLDTPSRIVTLQSLGQDCDATLVGETAEVLPGNGGWRTVVLLSGPRKGRQQRWRSNWWA